MRSDLPETNLLADAGVDRPAPNEWASDAQDLAALWVDLGGSD
jgi:hypothetical protein